MARRKKAAEVAQGIAAWSANPKDLDADLIPEIQELDRQMRKMAERVFGLADRAGVPLPTLEPLPEVPPKALRGKRAP